MPDQKNAEFAPLEYLVGFVARCYHSGDSHAKRQVALVAERIKELEAEIHEWMAASKVVGLKIADLKAENTRLRNGLWDVVGRQRIQMFCPTAPEPGMAKGYTHGANEATAKCAEIARAALKPAEPEKG